MALYLLQGENPKVLELSTLEGEGISERGDLQQLLMDHPDVMADGLLIAADAFSQWVDPRLRIDLLALARDGTLVVAEPKRTDDGGHMDLEAVRYAAMVANMTFDQVVEAHRRYLARHSIEGDARSRVVEFLQPSEGDEPEIDSLRPRILLVSGDFSKELTTSVLWLSDMGIDIRCLRVRPYRLKNELVQDIQQVIPLPEAEEYLVRVRVKAAKVEGLDYRKFRGLKTTLVDWQGNLPVSRSSHCLTLGPPDPRNPWLSRRFWT